jgi:predicted permease
MFYTVFFDILAPILVMVLLGAVMRWKFAIDLTTLSKLNIYLFAPVFVFYNVAHSKLGGSAMLTIVGVNVLQIVVLGCTVIAIGLALKLPRRTMAAVALTVCFYNSGNYGLPLADLAYKGEGVAAQTFVMLTQNVLTYTIGLTLAGMTGGASIVEGIVKFFRLPVPYTLTCALVARWWLAQAPDHQLPKLIEESTRYISQGLVPIALITLGAQLASNPRWPRWRPVALVASLRLFAAPVVMAGLLLLLKLFGADKPLRPVDHDLLILTAGTPTAVNTLLMTLEMDGDAQLAADCVFWTTVLSCLSLTVWLFFLLHRSAATG